MGSTAISIVNSNKAYIDSMEAVGFNIGLEAQNTHELTIRGINTTRCDTGISLDNSWDSDIKNTNIKNHSYRFSYTELALSIMTVNNIKN